MGWFQKKEPQAGHRVHAAMAITELLDESSVIVAASGLDKAGVLEALVAATCAAHELGASAPFIAKVREREQGISTTLDSGLSLPHARIDGLAEIAAGLAIVPGAGVVDPQQSDTKIRAMFLFFSPNRQDAFTKHLQVLRGVATLFQAPLIEELGKLKKPAEILARLRAAEG